MKKLLLSAMTLCLGIVAINAQIFKTDFLTGYTVGDAIEKGVYVDGNTPNMLDQWNLAKLEQGGASPLAVAPLTYTDFINSGKDVAIDLLSVSRATVYSLAPNSTTYASGTYYLGFMLNVSKATTSQGAEFICLDPDQRGGTWRARVGVKTGPDGNTFTIGVNGTNSLTNITWGDIAYNIGETYLVVLKATFDSSGNGTCALFVNPAKSATEPATATISTTLSGLSYIRAISVRQRSNFEAHMGGLCFTDDWSNLFDKTPTSIEDVNADKGEIVSVKYYNLNGVEVSSLPKSGVLIKQITYAGGLVETQKLIK